MKRLVLPFLTALIFSATIFGGCGSSRSKVEGYDDAQLSGKRVFVLLPDEGDYMVTSPSSFAWSRGIGEAGVPGRISSEFRTMFASALDARYDSNTVHNYATQSVGSTNPLHSGTDFQGAAESWDWSKLDVVRKNAAIDFMIVVNEVTINNSSPENGGDRGEERVSARARLIDMAKRKVLVEEQVAVSVDDPRQPRDTYVLLARELARKLPFLNQRD